MTAVLLKVVSGVRMISILIVDTCLVRFWRYRFFRDVVSRLCEKLSEARPIKYSEILEADALVQSYKPHELLNKNEIDQRFSSFSGGSGPIHPLISAAQIHVSE